jgi:hypothetical protein
MNIKMHPRFLFLVNAGLVLMHLTRCAAPEFNQNQACYKKE